MVCVEVADYHELEVTRSIPLEPTSWRVLLLRWTIWNPNGDTGMWHMDG